MKKKRIADWLEKMSAAFVVGAVLTDKDTILALVFAAIALGASLWLTDGGER